MQDVYKNIEEYNIGKKRKILIVFDDMIVDMINNKKLNPAVTELFIKGRKWDISIFFITQLHFKVPKDVRLNSTHFLIMTVLSKREIQQMALNHSSDIEFKDFIKIYENVLLDHILFWLMIQLPSDNSLRSRKNLLNKYKIKSW